jgi:alkylhydroperoxidase family enzyme
MARVSYVATAEAQGDAREVFAKLESRGSDILNLNRVLAHSPNVLRNFMRLGNSLLFHGVLPPRLRELAILRVAELTGAHYEWAHHVPIARQAGVRGQIAGLKSGRRPPLRRPGAGYPRLHRQRGLDG